MSEEPRAYTSDELRDAFLDEVRSIAKSWADPKIDRDIEGRCNGVAFSIMALLDGCSIGIPTIDLVFQPHVADKDHHIGRGENWIEPGTVVDQGLHEDYYQEKG
ncbi:hypothetical protein G6L37_07060 [Agrobacterium rubi]|nr:hypothetical protein [Agrobacterium rubi]NTF25125.1 hypothetical protein [Agrobacterium rubi]